jgi:hypothetical protein
VKVAYKPSYGPRNEILWGTAQTISVPRQNLPVKRKIGKKEMGEKPNRRNRQKFPGISGYLTGISRNLNEFLKI